MSKKDSGCRSQDLEQSWRRIASEGSLGDQRIEDVVAAVQDLGPDADPRILNPLMLHIADELTRLLRRRVWRSHRNEGNDIIERAHAQIIEAVLKPDSADGKALREAFHARVEFRLQDALRGEIEHARRYGIEPDEEGAGATLGDRHAVDGGPDQMEGHAYVEGLLAIIDDPRKRLAWRLHMEGVPIDSTKVSGTIARAVGVSGRQVQTWLDEVAELLKSKLGDRA